MKRVVLFILLFVFIIGGISCSKNQTKEIISDPSKISSVEIIPNKNKAKIGEKIVLTAIGRDKYYKKIPIKAEWQCVEGSGLFSPSKGYKVIFTPMKEGICYIQASIGNSKGMIGIEVIK